MADDDPKASHPFTIISAAGVIGVTRARVRALAYRQNIGILTPGRLGHIRRFTTDDVEQMRLMLTGPKMSKHAAWRQKHEATNQEIHDEEKTVH